MGIPGFNSWFAENHKQAYVPMGQVRVDHLYIDMNSVLHNVMRKARNWGHFHKALHKRLNSIIEVTKPQKTVMLAVDGPAPLAKLLTQRDRRKKSGRQVSEDDELTGVAITPGTTFMLDLTLSLAYFVCNKLSGARFRHVQFELSDGTVMGEGEVKILGRLARHWHPVAPNDTHVIVGDDADLILMALTSHIDHLYVANSALNDGRLDDRTRVFSVDLLHRQWASTLLAGSPAAAAPRAPELLSFKMDLTLLAILGKGNDYLPSLKGMAPLEASGRNSAWAVYQQLLTLQRRQQANEHATPEQQQGGGGRQQAAGGVGPAGAAAKGGGRAAAHAAAAAALPVISICPDAQVPRLDVGALALLLRAACGASGGGGNSDDWLGSKAAASPQQYLRGVVWLMQMYATGECPDYRFYYDGVAPSAGALLTTCEAFAARGDTHLTLASFPWPSEQEAAAARRPLLPIACALALLPARCRHLAAPCVRHLMGPSAGSAPGSPRGGAAAGAGAGDPMEIALDLGSDEGPQQLQDPDSAATKRARLLAALYEECATCNELGAKEGAAQRANAQAKEAADRAWLALEQAQQQQGGAERLAQLEQEAQRAQERYEAAKEQVKRTSAERRNHIGAAHPYQRFPVELLEQAAEEVVATGRIEPIERPATAFGQAWVLRVAAGQGAGAVAPWHQQQLQQVPGAPSQQQRHMSSVPGPAASPFHPPPPPFEVANAARFPPFARHAIANDSYRSGEVLKLVPLSQASTPLTYCQAVAGQAAETAPHTHAHTHRQHSPPGSRPAPQQQQQGVHGQQQQQQRYAGAPDGADGAHKRWRGSPPSGAGAAPPAAHQTQPYSGPGHQQQQQQGRGYQGRGEGRGRGAGRGRGGSGGRGQTGGSYVGAGSPQGGAGAGARPTSAVAAGLVAGPEGMPMPPMPSTRLLANAQGYASHAPAVPAYGAAHAYAYTYGPPPQPQPYRPYINPYAAQKQAPWSGTEPPYQQHAPIQAWQDGGMPAAPLPAAPSTSMGVGPYGSMPPPGLYGAQQTSVRPVYPPLLPQPAPSSGQARGGRPGGVMRFA